MRRPSTSSSPGWLRRTPVPRQSTGDAFTGSTADQLPTNQLRTGRGGHVVNLRRKSRTPPTDVVIELDNADELFAADPRGLIAGANRIDSGMDELVERLLAQKQITADQRVVLDIASECSDELAVEVVATVRRYCELRMRRANREHDLIWRQGRRC